MKVIFIEQRNVTYTFVDFEMGRFSLFFGSLVCLGSFLGSFSLWNRFFSYCCRISENYNCTIECVTSIMSLSRMSL